MAEVVHDRLAVMALGTDHKSAGTVGTKADRRTRNAIQAHGNGNEASYLRRRGRSPERQGCGCEGSARLQKIASPKRARNAGRLHRCVRFEDDWSIPQVV
jgi:hypothetical protein